MVLHGVLHGSTTVAESEILRAGPFFHPTAALVLHGSTAVAELK